MDPCNFDDRGPFLCLERILDQDCHHFCVWTPVILITPLQKRVWTPVIWITPLHFSVWTPVIAITGGKTGKTWFFAMDAGFASYLGFEGNLGGGECLHSQVLDIHRCSKKAGRSVSFLAIVTDQINDDGARQNQHIIFSLGNVDRISIRPGEPFLRDFRDHPTLSIEFILMIQEVA